MPKLIEEMEEMNASGDFGNGLYGLPERAAALEIERDALKAELKATESRLHEVAVGCANAEFELEEARKQEPCGWQCRFITPTETWGYCSKEHYETVKAAPHEYPGYEVRAVYASPLPTKISKGVAQVLIHAAISKNPELLELFYSPVPAQPSRELLRAIVDATWGHAYESEQVPSTATADKIINAALSKFTATANHEGANHGNG